MIIPRKYIDEIIKKYNDKGITVEMIKKDLTLSYLLQEMGDHINENKDSPFNKLIFKGGTLLAKSYLGYHRISEDLDFTFKDNKEINKLSKAQKYRAIKKFLKENLLPELTRICKKYDFDFDANEIDRQNEVKYCPLKYSEYWNKFNIYINNTELNPIKIEINFCEELFYDHKLSKIIHLNQSSKHLIYPLKSIYLESYHIEEILVEKIRAIITRPYGVHERDIYDLFLLSKLGYNPFGIDHSHIKNKICQGIGYKKNKESEILIIEKFEDRIKELEDNFEIEISEMNLTTYDSKEYKDFFDKMKEFILSIDFSDISK